MMTVWNVIGEEKFITYPAQQLQMQNGEHKSFSLSWEWLSWFEVNSVLVCTELFTSISAQGIHESIKKMIDNMAFTNFTTVKLGFLFLCLLFILNEY